MQLPFSEIVGKLLERFIDYVPTIFWLPWNGNLRPQPEDNIFAVIQNGIALDLFFRTEGFFDFLLDLLDRILHKDS